jgi:hypothetical protein
MNLNFVVLIVAAAVLIGFLTWRMVRKGPPPPPPPVQ